MTNPLEVLESYDIPTHSYIKAIQEINAREPWNSRLPADLYERRIKELSNKEVQVDEKYIRFVYLYLVQEIVRFSQTSTDFNLDELVSLAVHRAVEWVDNNPYLNPERETAPKLNAQGKPRKKKGAKKEAAARLYKENKGKSKPEIMEIFMKELEMSKAGAQTYFYNCKKEFGV